MGSTSEFTLSVRLFLKTYAWRRIDPVPWKPLPRPLSECRVGLVSSAGLVAPGQEPFDQKMRGGDWTHRVIDGDVDVSALIETHRSESFDHTAMRRDPNIAFPVDRLRELEARGAIGALNRRHLSFMGSITATGRLVRDSAVEAARCFEQDGVEAVLLVPVWPMCNQTVSLVAAEMERRGMSTVVIQLLRDVAERVRPPRALYVPFKHGYPLDTPGDPERQHAVLRAALSLLEDKSLAPPAIVDYEPGPM